MMWRKLVCKGRAAACAHASLGSPMDLQLDVLAHDMGTSQEACGLSNLEVVASFEL